MPKVVDITHVVPKSSENGKTVKGLKSHGKTMMKQLMKNDNVHPSLFPVNKLCYASERSSIYSEELLSAMHFSRECCITRTTVSLNT